MTNPKEHPKQAKVTVTEKAVTPTKPLRPVKVSNQDFFESHPLMKRLSKKTVSLFFALAMFSAAGCSTPSERLESAGEKVDLATSDFEEATAQYQMEVDSFKAHMGRSMAENQKQIEAIEVKRRKSTSSSTKSYDQDMEKLLVKHKKMEVKLNNYEARERDSWDMFKAEMELEMNNFRDSLKEFASKF
jgi:hypothetical protein